jgi:hypothetical protein
MIRAALLARPAARPLYGPALLWLGRRLSAWGERLLMRYSPPEAVGGCALPN